MARYSNEKLVAILAKTSCKCHLCHGALRLEHYGMKDSRYGWEVDHSKPRAKGGTDHLNNLWAAHVGCNRAKRAMPSTSVRGKKGFSRAPLSEEAREKRVNAQTLFSAIAGTAIGAMAGGPVTALLGALGLGLWASGRTRTLKRGRKRGRHSSYAEGGIEGP